MKRLVLLATALCLSFSVFAQTYLCVAEEYPPYEYLQDGKFAGLDIEMISRAAEKAGVKVRFEFFPWKRCLDMVTTGQADAIFSLSKTTERQGFLYFPDQYLGPEKNVILANPEFKGDVRKQADLKGLSVGVITEYAYGTEFDDDIAINKLPAQDMEELLRMLNGRRFPLCIANLPIAVYYLKKMGYKDIRQLSWVVSDDPLYLGISKASPRGKEFYTKINAGLQALEKSGELAKIRNAYLK